MQLTFLMGLRPTQSRDLRLTHLIGAIGGISQLAIPSPAPYHYELIETLTVNKRPSRLFLYYIKHVDREGNCYPTSPELRLNPYLGKYFRNRYASEVLGLSYHDELIFIEPKLQDLWSQELNEGGITESLNDRRVAWVTGVKPI